MSRFDVYRAKGPGIAGRERLVVVLQHRHLDDLETIVVALYRLGELPAVERLRPTVGIGRKRYRAAVDRMASIPKRLLGTVVGSAETSRYELLGAVDLIFSGF
jgi:hypothetical protein